MQIGILSDIHDHVWHLQAALRGLAEAEALICCGDLCSPFIIGLLAEGFPGRPIHLVFGNNDGDLFRITQNAHRFPQVQLHGELFRGELGGRQLLVNHYPDIARSFAPEGLDLICYGHNHVLAIEQRDTTLLVNPGTIMGYEPGGKREVPATFMLYDTTTAAIETLQIVTAAGADGVVRQVVPYA